MNQWIGLTHFTKGPSTTGQICQVYGVPVEWIAIWPAFNPANEYLSGDIVLGLDKYWIRFNVGATGKSFEETSKILKGRIYWEHKLSFKLFWQSGPQHVKLQNACHHKWVFLFREAGTLMYYVVGTPPVGASLTMGYSNQAGTATEMQASHQALSRAPLYQGQNKAMCRLTDIDGNYITDVYGNYVLGVCNMADVGAGDFNSTDFSNVDFVV